MQLNTDRGCWVCPYCDTEVAPETNAEGVRVLDASDLNCPICAVKLSTARLLDYGLLYCQTCAGMLIQMSDLVPLSDDLRVNGGGAVYIGRPPDPKQLDRKINCPRCTQTMDTHQYGGPGNIIIDTCEPCEVHWLDRGELRRIALAPDRSYQE